MSGYVGDELDRYLERDYREVDLPARTIRHLYGPDGEVLATISDTPPVGFHQGQRDR